jgi:membrane-associated phospholipid phosphatase
MTPLPFRNRLRNNSWFILPYLVLILLLLFLHLCLTKSTIHLFINSHNSAFLDLFFKYITILGHGFFTMAIVCIFLFFHYRKSLIVFLAFIVSGIIVQSLKTTIFAESLRPTGYFEGKTALHLVEGVYQLYIQSFPSGHSASAFALFLCLAAFTKSKLLKFLLFTIASLTAFSRVYLSQHFLVDAMAGSFIGVIVSLLIIYFLYDRKPLPFLDNSIIPNRVK